MLTWPLAAEIPEGLPVLPLAVVFTGLLAAVAPEGLTVLPLALVSTGPLTAGAPEALPVLRLPAAAGAMLMAFGEVGTLVLCRAVTEAVLLEAGKKRS